MKIKTVELPYADVAKLPRQPHLNPLKPGFFFRMLLRTLSSGELKQVGFTLESENMERLDPNEPALFLMNHSCFLDLKIASSVLYPRPFNIICTSDGFVGKNWLLRHLGCIPTQKFSFDPALVRDRLYTVRTLRSSLLLYPEASYSFDGTATPLPGTLGKCLKLLKIPVVMIRTEGAFLRDPLYNGLQLRKVRVKAIMKYLLSPEEIARKPADELNRILKDEFTFDAFRWQQENGIRITESFRADGLNRVLYKCPVCGTEGAMKGEGISLLCGHCRQAWQLSENGLLETEEGTKGFDHIPDWYAWERQEVRKEILSGRYGLDIPVEIRMLVNTKSLYSVGSGRLRHTCDGFLLTGCGGRLVYRQPPEASYSLYADYFWYEIGDMISIGDAGGVFYCFPQSGGDVVAKTRLATEELYKLRCRREEA